MKCISTSFYSLIEESNAEDTNIKKPFIRKTIGGKLIIDIEDLRCLSTDKKRYEILRVLTELEAISNDKFKNTYNEKR